MAKKIKGIKAKSTTKDRLFSLIVYTLLGLALIVVLYPLIYIISASISSPTEVGSGRMWLWPLDITFGGYDIIFKNADIWNGYKNTIFYTLLGTSINLFVTLPCAYALSRKNMLGKKAFMKMLVITMFISGGLIPTFILVKSLGMYNTIWALVIPNAASVYNIVVTRTFFETTIPDELEESASVDGASDLRIFFQIVLPLSMPIVAVMALFYGVGQWNGYFNALIYLSDRSLYPLQLILREILVVQDMSSNTTNFSTTSAEMLQQKQQLVDVIKYGVMIVSTLPVIMIYPFLQRFFVKGVMIGSIKG
ncbi:MAG: carbohydrate ABC transporter permease [Bifidobacteriaceae bacterium]|jgi:putative aldouronate transport system permease protein|nr:carbohydrate ABC transporter permease [Bifidobacteriaceae bacterium]